MRLLTVTSSESKETSRTHKPALGFILLTLMLDVLGFGLLIPVAPKLIENLLAKDTAREVVGGLGEKATDTAGAALQGASDLSQSSGMHALGGGLVGEAAHYYGWLVATYAIMSFLCAPILGALSDRFGRRPVLLISLFGSGMDYFALALSPTLWILYVTRAINGMSGGSITVCNAYIADITPPEKRAAAFGMVGAAFGVGFILGPLMGGYLGNPDTEILWGLLGKGNIHYPFYAAGTLTLINWMYGCFVLPESLSAEKRAARFNFARANPFGAFGHLLDYPIVAGLASAFFLFNLAQFSLHTTWVLYTAYRYEWEAVDVGLSLAFVGLMAAIVQGGLARKIVPALGERRALMLGLGLGTLSYLGYGAATEGWMIYAVIGLGSLGGITMPAAQSLITKSVRPDEQGAIQGTMTAMQSIAQILGPIIGTSVFAWSIATEPKVPGGPGACFYAGAMLAALGWVIAAYVLYRRSGGGQETGEARAGGTTS